MPKKEFLKNAILIFFIIIVAVALGQSLPYMVNMWNGPFKKGNYIAHINKYANKLTLYGTTTCPHCASARKYLNEKGIAFNDILIDRSSEAAASFKQLNENGVPILVSKDKLVVGFNSEIYDEFYKVENSK